MATYVRSDPLYEIHYCKLCKEVFTDDPNIFHCGTANCEGLRYKGPFSKQSQSQQPRKSFVFADVKKQLADLLQTPGIWKDIESCRKRTFDRIESETDVIPDITDGSEYRRLMKDGGFLSEHNITEILNTDGVNLYSSSRVELWPIVLAINELNPQKRFSRENMLLDAIWQGKGKPPFEATFKLFGNYKNNLFKEGVELQLNDKSFNVKLSVICGLFDLPAKAEVLNMSYFNGSHPCIKCEENGTTVKQG